MNPINRKEKYYQGILDGTSSGLPTPITREEAYLKAIAENGGGGGESTGIWKPSVSNEGVISWEKSTSTATPEEQNIKGPQGETGETGATGETGPAGPGLASGGVAGSLLFKSSNDDYATEWVDSGIATVEGNPATANTDSAGIGVQTVVDIEPIQAGSGDPSPENVREISGYESVEVEVYGRNALHLPNAVYQEAGTTITVSDGVITVNGTSTEAINLTLGTFDEKGTFIANDKNASGRISIYTSNNLFNFDSPNTFTSDGTETTVKMYFGANQTFNNVQLKPMVRLSTDSDDTFEAPKGYDLTIPLPETVYGGTLDVESGTLTVDRGIIDLGDLTWVKGAVGFDTTGLANLIKLPASNYDPANIICSIYSTKSIMTASNGDICVNVTGNMVAIDSRYSDAATFKTAVTGQKLVYELATPYTISLPPHQIKLLQGENNLSTNAHSISLTYRKGKVVMNSDLEGLADSVNVLADEVDSFGIKPLTATALSDAVTISTFSAMKINKNVIFSCRVVITPTEEGSMPLFAINGVECPFYHTATGRNTVRGIDGRWSIDKDTNILAWTVVSTELDRSNDILIQGVLAVK